MQIAYKSQLELNWVVRLRSGGEKIYYRKQEAMDYFSLNIEAVEIIENRLSREGEVTRSTILQSR